MNGAQVHRLTFLRISEPGVVECTGVVHHDCLLAIALAWRRRNRDLGATHGAAAFVFDAGNIYPARVVGCPPVAHQLGLPPILHVQSMLHPRLDCGSTMFKHRPKLSIRPTPACVCVDSQAGLHCPFSNAVANVVVQGLFDKPVDAVGNSAFLVGHVEKFGWYLFPLGNFVGEYVVVENHVD